MRRALNKVELNRRQNLVTSHEASQWRRQRQSSCVPNQLLFWVVAGAALFLPSQLEPWLGIKIFASAECIAVSSFLSCGAGCYHKDGLTTSCGKGCTARLCHAVGAGYYSPEGDNHRYACPSGFTSCDEEAAQCWPCPAGTVQPQVGQCDCDLCPPGSFQAASGQDTCEQCPVGSYSKDEGSIGCQDCLPGYEGTGATAAVDGGDETLICLLNAETAPPTAFGVAPSVMPSEEPSDIWTSTPSTTASTSGTSEPAPSKSYRPTTIAPVTTVVPSAPSPYPSLTASASVSSEYPSLFPTDSKSEVPSMPTMHPSVTPSRFRTLHLTEAPSPLLALHPTAAPSLSPMLHPTALPSLSPTMFSSLVPTTSAPTSPSPSQVPTNLSSTVSPSVSPVNSPTLYPSIEPTFTPPTLEPTIPPSSRAPSATPTLEPTRLPSSMAPIVAPLIGPSSAPSMVPSTTKHPTKATTRMFQFSPSPSMEPSSSPSTATPTSLQPTTGFPSETPTTGEPSAMPTISPTTGTPSSRPSGNPSNGPTTIVPTKSPSLAPSPRPTTSPTNLPSTTSPTVLPTVRPSTVGPSRNPSESPTTTAPITFHPTQSEVLTEPPAKHLPTSNPILFTLSPRSKITSPHPTPQKPASSTVPSTFPSSRPSAIPIATDITRPPFESSLLPSFRPSTSWWSATPSASPSLVLVPWAVSTNANSFDGDSGDTCEIHFHAGTCRQCCLKWNETIETRNCKSGDAAESFDTTTVGEFYPRNDNCWACPSTAWKVCIPVFVIMTFMGLLVIRRRVTGGLSVVGPLLIGLDFAQIASALMLATTVPWPSGMMTAIRLLSLSNYDVSSAISPLDCILKASVGVNERSAFELLSPPLVLLVLVMAWRVASKGTSYWTTRHWLLLTVYFSYTKMTTTGAEAFRCLMNTGEHDESTVCSSGVMTAAYLASIALLSLGFPLWMAIKVLPTAKEAEVSHYDNGDICDGDDRHRGATIPDDHRIHWLFQPFSAHARWWPLILFAKRFVLLVTASVLRYTGSSKRIQLLVLLAMILLFLALHWRWRPYKSIEQLSSSDGIDSPQASGRRLWRKLCDNDNYVACLTHLSICVMICIALGLADNNTKTTDQIVTTVFVSSVAVTVAMLLFVIWRRLRLQWLPRASGGGKGAKRKDKRHRDNGDDNGDGDDDDDDDNSGSRNCDTTSSMVYSSSLMSCSQTTMTLGEGVNNLLRLDGFQRSTDDNTNTLHGTGRGDRLGLVPLRNHPLVDGGDDAASGRPLTALSYQQRGPLEFNRKDNDDGDDNEGASVSQFSDMSSALDGERRWSCEDDVENEDGDDEDDEFRRRALGPRRSHIVPGLQFGGFRLRDNVAKITNLEDTDRPLRQHE